MIKQVRNYSTLIILCCFEIYTLVMVVFGNAGLLEEHEWGFGVLALISVCYLLKPPAGHLMTLVGLLIGAFGRASFTPTVYWFSLGSLKMSWPYLGLISYYFFVNKRELPEWGSFVFGHAKRNTHPEIHAPEKEGESRP